jgi:hypothetical protein
VILETFLSALRPAKIGKVAVSGGIDCAIGEGSVDDGDVEDDIGANDNDAIMVTMMMIIYSRRG